MSSFPSLHFPHSSPSLLPFHLHVIFFSLVCSLSMVTSLCVVWVCWVVWIVGSVSVCALVVDVVDVVVLCSYLFWKVVGCRDTHPSHTPNSTHTNKLNTHTTVMSWCRSHFVFFCLMCSVVWLWYLRQPLQCRFETAEAPLHVPSHTTTPTKESGVWKSPVWRESDELPLNLGDSFSSASELCRNLGRERPEQIRQKSSSCSPARNSCGEMAQMNPNDLTTSGNLDCTPPQKPRNRRQAVSTQILHSRELLHVRVEQAPVLGGVGHSETIQ